MDQINKSKNILKIIPWYMGISYGLLFYTPISTLFFTIAKNLSLSQITMLGTISTIISIISQPFILKIMKKIGNTYSVRIGAFMLLISVLCITFGNFYIIMLGFILESIAFVFNDMINIILRNNLKFLNKDNEYIKYKNKSFLLYSVLTAIIALLASYLFNLNHYLPMFFCAGSCIIISLMSLFINDVKLLSTEDIEEKSNFSKIIPKSNTIFNIILFFGIIRACIALGFSNTELFIQDNLKTFFDITNTTYYFGIIIFISRIVRIISNIIFNKVYIKFREKLIYILPILLLISFILLIFSYYLISNLLIKFSIMGFAYAIIVVLIDSFNAVIQDAILRNSNSEEHQSALTYLSLSYKIFKAIFGCCISLILLKYSLIYVLIFLIMLVLMGLVQFRKTYLKLL